jgi:hypothetical protein
LNKYSPITIALATSTSILMSIAATTIIFVSQTGQILPLKVWLTTGFYSASSITGFASILLLLKKKRFGNILALSSAIFGLTGFSIIFISAFIGALKTRSEVLMLAVGGLSFIFLMLIMVSSIMGFENYKPQHQHKT